MNLIHHAKSNLDAIAKTDFCMFKINVEKCGLTTHSLGITCHSLNELIDSATGDLNDKRTYSIQSSSWAYYFNSKQMLKQCENKFNCKFTIYEKKEEINKAKLKTYIDIEGRRQEVSNAYDQLQSWQHQFACKNVTLRIKNFEMEHFCQEILQVKQKIEQDNPNVILDIQDVQIKFSQCQQKTISSVVIKVLSLNEGEAENLKTFLNGSLSYSQSEPVILTRDQFLKLQYAMKNGDICQKGDYYHLYFDQTSDNTHRVALYAMQYFANNAMPKGTALLQPYLQLHREEYRPSNASIAVHLLSDKNSIQAFHQMAVENDVCIQAKQNYSEAYILTGSRENVLKQLHEMENFENELKTLFIKESIDISFPISNLLTDQQFATIMNTLTHHDVNVKLIPQVSPQIELQNSAIIGTYEKTLAIQKVTIEIWKGDITKLQIDAIVNAANTQLQHGGGVAHAISDAGGPQIQIESDAYIHEFGQIPVSCCVCLSPGNLRCKCIIHAVGPTWDSNNSQEVTQQLHRCISNICSLASQVGMNVIAIPTISAGLFAFPQKICSQTIIESLDSFFIANSHSSLSKVILIDINDDILSCLKSQCDNTFKSQASSSLPKNFSPIGKMGKIASTITSVYNAIRLTAPSAPAAIFEWQENDSTWKSYDPATLLELQNAYKANSTGSAQTTRSKYTYTVNFSTLIQTNNQTGVNRKIRIVNRTVDPQNLDLTNSQVMSTSLNLPAPPQDIILEPPIDLLNPQWSKITKEQICLYGHKDRLQHAKSLVNDFVETRMRTKEHELTDISKQSLHKMLTSLKEKYNFLQISVKTSDNRLDTYTIQLSGYFKFVKDASSDIQLAYRDILLQEKKVNTDPPQHWKPQCNNLMIVEMVSNTREYQAVANNFLQTCQKVILKIERIQNCWLWTRYMQDKERMEKKCAAGANEIRVFHGTRDNPPERIYNGEKGFDHRFCNGMWGPASYFAVNAQYCDSGYFHLLSDGTRQIFMVCLCAGDVFHSEPDSNLRKPPLKAQTRIPSSTQQLNFTDVYYDTVSGNTSGTLVYMLYETGRAYPEYLITYR